MQLILSDNSSFNIDIIENRVWDHLKRGYKHLQHIPVQFYPWDNQVHFNTTREELVASLVVYAKDLDIEIDTTLSLKGDQQYSNDLHEIYEKGYDGRREWLPFHEHIHQLENLEREKLLKVSWREQGGLLEKPFTYSLLEDAVTDIKKGTVYVKWRELGKTPYHYWLDNEPNNIKRLCEVSRPWILLKYDFYIAFEDIDLLHNVKSTEFNDWWKDYHDLYCKHYNIPKWTLEQMLCVIPFGQVENVNLLQDSLKNNNPQKIKL